MGNLYSQADSHQRPINTALLVLLETVILKHPIDSQNLIYLIVLLYHIGHGMFM